MTLDSDRYTDRRRLKRHLTGWRIGAVVAVVVAIAALAAPLDGTPGGDHIARLDVTGIIVDDPIRADAIRELIDDDAVKALIVRIDSPGGTVVGGETLHDALRQVAAKKPVVAIMSEVAASGGYMTAVAADRIFARAGTITGSIGVIMQTTQITGLLEKLGIEPLSIKSAPLKAQPNPLEPITEEARKAMQAIIGDMFQMFVDMVDEGRPNLDRTAVLALADGRVYTGRQALTNGLVDALGGEAEALDWLAETKEIDRELPVFDVKIDYEEQLVDRILGSFSGKMVSYEGVTLDGLVALWHPGIN